MKAADVGWGERFYVNNDEPYNEAPPKNLSLSLLSFSLLSGQMGVAILGRAVFKLIREEGIRVTSLLFTTGPLFSFLSSYISCFTTTISLFLVHVILVTYVM